MWIWNQNPNALWKSYDMSIKTKSFFVHLCNKINVYHKCGWGEKLSMNFQQGCFLCLHVTAVQFFPGDRKNSVWFHISHMRFIEKAGWTLSVSIGSIMPSPLKKIRSVILFALDLAADSSHCSWIILNSPVNIRWKLKHETLRRSDSDHMTKTDFFTRR